MEVCETKRCGMRALSFKPIADEQHAHRNLKDITKIITQSDLTAPIKERATKIFQNLAVAEASVHGEKADELFFHEVGAVDSIADIVGACVCLEALNVGKVYCSCLSAGGGVIKSAHGVMAAPAPATVELLKQARTPVVGGPETAELLTPTAAAILINFVDEFGLLPAMTIDSVGYGAGARQFDEFPNVLRLIIGESACEDANTDCVCLLETNIDDTTGETIGFVIEKLFEEGALDVFTTPIQMKRNRPGVLLSVMCGFNDFRKMENILFKEGLTFGIRRQIIQRTRLARSFITVKTDFGEIRIKTGTLDGKTVTAKPEYSDCAEAAKRHKVALKIVCQAAMAAFAAKRPK